MSRSQRDRIEQRFGQKIQNHMRLSGGSIAAVWKLDLGMAEPIVAKIGDAQSDLALEGRMLTYLRETETCHVPEVFIADQDLLVMSLIDNEGPKDDAFEKNLAETIANLHSTSAETFGFDEETVIGGLVQVNPRMTSWVDFYGEARLLAMADQALSAGKLNTPDRSRLDRFVTKLDHLISEPARPQLVHGDLWHGNITASQDGTCGLIDPAIYFGHAEVDLAFATLFDSLGKAFFNRYHEIRPIEDGFFEERRDIYNLYPLLVHIRLFGGHYRQSFDRILRKFGC